MKPLTDSTPSLNGAKETRIPSLDGWRAIAILLVLGSHWPSTRGFPQDAVPWWGNVFQGNLGVRLFFVISGFLITYLLLRESDRSGTISLGNFYCRRILRIFPVYFLYLGVLIILSLTGYYKDSWSSWIGSLTFTRNMLGTGDSATGHLWSLAVEEQFYLAWPICLFAWSLWRRPGTAIAVLLTLLLISPYFRCHSLQPTESGNFFQRVFDINSIFMYTDSLAVGCIGAFVYQRKGIQLSATAYSVLLPFCLLVVVALAWIALGQDSHPVMVALVPGIQAIALMLMIYASIENRSGIIFSLLNCPFMTTVGVLSYSIYIWHFLFLSDYIGPRLNQFLLYDWRIWWLPALGASVLSYYFVEKPCLRFKTRFQVHASSRGTDRPQ